MVQCGNSSFKAELTIIKLRVGRQKGYHWKDLRKANQLIQHKRLLSVELKNTFLENNG
jgi:hypothetical protein